MWNYRIVLLVLNKYVFLYGQLSIENYHKVFDEKVSSNLECRIKWEGRLKVSHKYKEQSTVVVKCNEILYKCFVV